MHYYMCVIEELEYQYRLYYSLSIYLSFYTNTAGTNVVDLFIFLIGLDCWLNENFKGDTGWLVQSVTVWHFRSSTVNTNVLPTVLRAYIMLVWGQKQ